jgi:leucyl-tRNA---protein transferase
MQISHRSRGFASRRAGMRSTARLRATPPICHDGVCWSVRSASVSFPVTDAENSRTSQVKNRLHERLMETTFRGVEPPGPCSYVPAHNCIYEYSYVSKSSADEYQSCLVAGWRRFGHTFFRQTCSGPAACRSLRVDAASFSPSRSHRRTRRANEGSVRLCIGKPAITAVKIAVFERFQADRSASRGWAPYESADVVDFLGRLAFNPFPTEEWCYYLDDALIGVGYVDALSRGLSAIYFARDPAYRERSLGTWNVLCLLDRARSLSLPHVYLGYHTDRCPSLRYKASFRPNEHLDLDGVWRVGTK